MIKKYLGNCEDKNSEYYKATHNSDGHLICCDCGNQYREFNDLSIDDKLWAKITPSYDNEAGILCPTCILKRLREIGCNDFKLICNVSNVNTK